MAGSPLKLIGTSPTPNTVSMLNWPGAKGKFFVPSPSSTSRSSVQTCGASRRLRRTRATHGTIGSIGVRSKTGGSGGDAIDIENLQPHRLEALHEDWHEALHHLVTEIVVGLTFPA